MDENSDKNEEGDTDSLISLGFGVELIATEFFLQSCAYLSVP